MTKPRARAFFAILLSATIAATVSTPLFAQAVALIVDAPPELESAATRVRNIDRNTLAGSLAAAGLPMPQRIEVTLVARGDPRTARIPDWVVGLAAGTSQIVIFPDRVGPYPHDSLESVVRHEIVHLALNTRAAGHSLPRWFHEGVATTSESGWGVRENARLLLAALDPPSIADLTKLFASDAYPDSAQAYLLSAALVNEIRREHGREVPGAIAMHVASGLPFDDAFRKVTGETVDAAADRAWAGYRRISRWLLVATDPSTVWTFILLLAFVAFAFQLRRRRERRRQWDEEDEDEHDTFDRPDDDEEGDGRDRWVH